MASWKPVVVGIDSSEAAAQAAAVGWDIARTAGARCVLVHATHDVAAAPSAEWMRLDVDRITRELTTHAREELARTLRHAVPPEALNQIDIRIGRAPWVLAEVVRECGAGLVVLGGKHHAPLGGWISGRTAQHMAGTLDTPLLVTAHQPGTVRHVLAAVDLSWVAAPTLEVAGRFADLFGAELRVLHAVEPLPMMAGLQPQVLDQDDYRKRTESQLEAHVWPLLAGRKAEAVVRHGAALDAITAECTDWKADLLVVGSHGRGWVDRVLLGSTTERLLNRLPVSTVVAPAPPPEPPRGR